MAIGVGLIEARYNKRHYGSSVFVSWIYNCIRIASDNITKKNEFASGD